MDDFIEDNLGFILIVAIVSLIVLATWAVQGAAEARANWMAQCQEDYKPYECEIAWEQAHQSNAGNSLATGLAIGMIAGSRR